MLANQLQLWKFLDPSTNFDSITEFAVLEVALEIPKRAQYYILPWFIIYVFQLKIWHECTSDMNPAVCKTLKGLC